jgi:hypothetical protein
MAAEKLTKLSEDIDARGFDFVKDIETLGEIYGTSNAQSSSGFCQEFFVLMIEGLRCENEDHEAESKDNPRERAKKLIQNEIRKHPTSRLR